MDQESKNDRLEYKKHLKALMFVSLVAISVLLAIYSYLKITEYSAQSKEQAHVFKVELGETLRSFEAIDLNHNKFSLSQLQGKTVIVNFWASWCTPCVEEIPSILKLLKVYNKKLNLLAISEDSSELEIKTFIKSFPGLNSDQIIIIRDENKQLMRRFNIDKLPESFILDKNLTIVKRIIGTINWYTDDSKAYINTL